MRYYTHITASMLIFLLLAFIFQIDGIIMGIIIAGTVAVLPDITEKLLTKEHRTIGHSIFLWIPILVTLFFFNFQIFIAVSSAIFSHILFDLLTVRGCMLLYPKQTVFVALNEKRRVKTGTQQEKAVFVFLLMLFIPAFLFSFNLVQLFPDVTGNSITGAVQNLTGVANESNQRINVNIQIDERMLNRNLTIQRNPNDETQIIVTGIGNSENDRGQRGQRRRIYRFPRRQTNQNHRNPISARQQDPYENEYDHEYNQGNDQDYYDSTENEDNEH